MPSPSSEPSDSLRCRLGAVAEAEREGFSAGKEPAAVVLYAG